MQFSHFRRGDYGIAHLQGALRFRSGPVRLTTDSLVGGPITSVDPLLPVAEGSDEPDDLLFSGGELHIDEYGDLRFVTMAQSRSRTVLLAKVPDVEGPATLMGAALGRRSTAGQHHADRRLDHRHSSAARPSAQERGSRRCRSDTWARILPDGPQGTVLGINSSDALVRAISGFARPAVVTRCPRADEVTKGGPGRVDAISTHEVTFLQVSPDQGTTLANGLCQPHGLGPDSAGNPVMSDDGQAG